MTYRNRRRLALVALLVWLPLYVVVAVWLVDQFPRQSLPVELAIYVGLGFLWMAPLRRVFLGVGKADPDAEKRD